MPLIKLHLRLRGILPNLLYTSGQRSFVLSVRAQTACNVHSVVGAKPVNPQYFHYDCRYSCLVAKLCQAASNKLSPDQSKPPLSWHGSACESLTLHLFSYGVPIHICRAISVICRIRCSIPLLLVGVFPQWPNI